jgi:ABC-type multidrug transport system fused ATPase/permease subunit
LRIRIAELTGYVVERITNVATIKNYAQENRELSNFGGMVDRNLGLSRRQHKLNLFFGSLTTIITGFGTLSVLFLGFLNIRGGSMQLGEVLAFYQITGQLFVPISALVGLTTVTQTLQVLASRVYNVLDTPAMLQEAKDAVEPGEIKGEIDFEHVSLRYEEGGPFAVEDINLAIPAGKTVCIVGPTGCGKSTLLMLLSRFYDPNDGVIRLDGIDIRKIPLETLRHKIGNVLHDTQVFSGTFAENIAYGAPDASQEDIEAAARLVELHDFIQNQPEAYKAKLGRGGITLNTEQLVKLGIARALVTKPAILTVDDTYTTIEEEIEQRLRSAVRDALADQTILIATSRLSICEDADMVVVMRMGKIIQVGTHEQLLATPDLYRRMYMRQMGLEVLDEALQT